VSESTVAAVDGIKQSVLINSGAGQRNTRDGVHEGNVDANGLRNQIFHFSQHCQLILGLDVFWVSSVQARDQASERGYPDTLAYPQDR
jgi:hypothetical protein